MHPANGKFEAPWTKQMDSINPVGARVGLRQFSLKKHTYDTRCKRVDSEPHGNLMFPMAFSSLGVNSIRGQSYLQPVGRRGRGND